MYQFFKLLVIRFAIKIIRATELYTCKIQLKNINAGKNVRLGSNSFIKGNITICDNTYINSHARIKTGSHSNIRIGKNCAIGRFFSCASITHDFNRPTMSEDFGKHLTEENDIKIGDGVWIGDKVTIKDGISIGNYAVIGANSVVVKDVLDFEVVGGIPAKHIRYNTEHFQYKKNY